MADRVPDAERHPYGFLGEAGQLLGRVEAFGDTPVSRSHATVRLADDRSDRVLGQEIAVLQVELHAGHAVPLFASSAPASRISIRDRSSGGIGVAPSPSATTS